MPAHIFFYSGRIFGQPCIIYIEKLPSPYCFSLLLVAVLTASFGIVAGVLFSASGNRVRLAIPLSAGILLGVALFGLLPELARELSWTTSLLFFAAGFVLLTVLDRMGVPICPDCSQDHDHHACAVPLHGFAGPLLIAAGVHSLFDGWAIAVSTMASSTAVKVALPLALVLHKLPEGLALGIFLKHSLGTRRLAITLAIGAELLTFVGGAISTAFAPRLGSGWTSYPLAIAGGFFLFLAFHALEGEWRKNPRLAIVPGAAGILLSAMLQAGVHSYFGG